MKFLSWVFSAFLFQAVLWAGTLLAFSADSVFELPRGFYLDPANAPFSFVGNVLAFAAENDCSPEIPFRVYLIQTSDNRNPQILSFTDFPRHVFHLQLSPKKDRLLVYSSDPNQDEDDPHIITLLKSNGDILWSQKDPPKFRVFHDG